MSLYSWLFWGIMFLLYSMLLLLKKFEDEIIRYVGLICIAFGLTGLGAAWVSYRGGNLRDQLFVFIWIGMILAAFLCTLYRIITYPHAKK
jgi:apolipoprotein N-acyltransferase